MPLLVVAAVGRRSLAVDVENLAMKSVGTGTEQAEQVRIREFGNEPRVFLLATPRAPSLFVPLDEEEIQGWIRELSSRPEITALTSRPTENTGEHAVAVSIRTSPEGRYADSIDSFSAAAREELPPTYRVSIAGVPVVEVAIAREMSAERARILPLIGAALALVLLIVYRHPVLVLAALLAPLTGVFLLEGLQGLLGLAVDPVSALLGPTVLTVGVASSVHVLERYRRALRDLPVVEASLLAARDLRVPLLLTVATTVAGFLGLLASPVPAVRRFGLLASLGVLLVVATALLCLPSLLRLLHRPGRGRGHGLDRADLVHPMLVRRFATAVVIGTTLIAVAAGIQLGGSKVDSDPLTLLSRNDRVRRDSERIAHQLGGSETFELLLPPDGPSGPFFAAALVGKISDLEGVVGPCEPPRGSSSGYGLLTFLLARGGSEAREVLFDRAEELAAEAGWKGARATGLAVRVARDSGDLVRGQRRGILLTIGALGLVMTIGFRSARLGLLGLIPNVLPVVLIHGALGAAGRPTSVASSMIGCVMLGLVVDDTIHLLHAWRGARGEALRRMGRALHAVRRPILITSAVLAAGFLTTVLGRLGATREFGLLAAATMVIALVADLVLLPALLLWRRPRRTSEPRKHVPCLELPRTTS